MANKKLIIGGYNGSGKSTLCLLLDGHPRTRVSYLMENFDRVFTAGLPTIQQRSSMAGARSRNLAAYFSLRVGDDQYPVHFTTFRDLLEKYTYLSVIEAEALVGETDSSATVHDIHSVRLALDFEKFQASWKSRLFLSPEVVRTREDVLDILYDSLFTAFRDIDWTHRENSVDVFCIRNSLDPIELALEENFDAKFIVLTRPRDDYWVSYIERIAYQQGGVPFAKAEQVARERWATHPKQAIDLRMTELAAGHPDRFMMLDIADVVVNYRETMPRIAQFMGIEMMPALLTPTYHGNPLPNAGDYVGQVNDGNRGHLVSALTREILELQYREASIGQALMSSPTGAALEYSRLLLKRSRWAKVLPV